MKKLILIVLTLLLTGCFEDSGYITKSCAKTDTADGFSNTIKYTFRFKNNIIDSLIVNSDYNSTDSNTISSIKLSVETQNKYLSDLKYNVLVDEINHYQIEYDLDINSNNDIKSKFIIEEKRSDLVEKLENEGFVCK